MPGLTGNNGPRLSAERRLTNLAPSVKLRLGAAGKGVAALQDYLSKYGYMDPSSSEPSSSVRRTLSESRQMLIAYDALARRAFASTQYALDTTKGKFDVRTEGALKRLQEFHGLKPTGVVDKPTRKLLSQVRYDHHPDVALFVIATPWNHTDLSYQFLNSTSATLPDMQARAVIRRAFQTWQNASKLTFREIGSEKEADIKIKWARLDHGDGSPFDGLWGVLAHGFFPPGRGDNNGALHFDDDEHWFDSASCSYERKEADLLTIAAHEIGHCLGLDHSREHDALMYSYYGGPRRSAADPSLAKLGSDDTDAIKSLYS